MNISSGGKVEKGLVREDGQFLINVDTSSDLFRYIRLSVCQTETKKCNQFNHKLRKLCKISSTVRKNKGKM